MGYCRVSDHRGHSPWLRLCAAFAREGMSTLFEVSCFSPLHDFSEKMRENDGVPYTQLILTRYRQFGNDIIYDDEIYKESNESWRESHDLPCMPSCRS